MTIKAKKSKINLREKLAELLNFRQIRDRLDGLGLYIGKDRTGTTENVAVRGGANIDGLQLAEISAAVGGTAVDVFVYDTRNDSDGGKWRERTQHTSWYNEELNTATRGGRREFPAVAVIVAEAGKVTIYDGDDPDLNMWMVFEQGSVLEWASTSSNCTSLSFLNGVLVVGSRPSSVILFNFLGDDIKLTYFQNQYFLTSGRFIVDRNNSISVSAGGDGIDIVNNNVNDVAMTILPNAPIDQNTGLPVPTIAVATDGGVSVIKDDGSVVDKGTTSAAVNQVQWMGSGRLVASAPAYYGVFDNPFVEESAAYLGYISDNVYNADHDKNYLYQVPNIMTQLDGSSKLLTLDARTIIASTSAGLNVHEMGEGAAANNNHGIATYITSEYNTGWMPGDIKLATLSDTTVETIGVNSDELVTNPDFVDTNSDGADDWILSNAATTSTSGTAVTITNGGADFGYIYQVVDTEIGKQYLFSVDVDYISNNGRILLGKDGSNTSSSLYFHEEDINSDKTIEYYFTAETETLYVRIGLQNNTLGDSISFDNISVRATTELITNGDFSTNVTASDGQTSGGWTSSQASLSVTGDGKLRVTNSGTVSGYAHQSVKTVVGNKYICSFDVTFQTAAVVNLWVGTSAGSYNVATSGGLTSTGSYAVTFTATSTTTYLSLIISPGINLYHDYDNISVRPAVDDRSVNNNGLQIVGAIDKTRVAPGADLVAYSGFSTNNYLMQPYNSDLDFGTGDFSIMGWVKLNSAPYGTSIGCIAAISDTSLKFYLNVTHDTGSFGLFLNDSTKITSESTAKAGSWAFVVAKRTSGELSISVNGKKNANDVTYLNAINITSHPITSIGFRLTDGDAELNGSLALLRISKTAPTDAQIAKIYRDEKVLFQDGAQATLYGTDDAVTALAYDDKTELLHVGTSSGRSDFAGLRRINNTTTAVTTSISASNNLIAEQ